MLVNRIGDVIGVSANRVEVDVLADVTPSLVRSLFLSVKATRMSDSARHIEIMTPTQVAEALAEANAQYPSLCTDALPDGVSPRMRTVHRVATELRRFLHEPPVLTETVL